MNAEEDKKSPVDKVESEPAVTSAAPDTKDTKDLSEPRIEEIKEEVDNSKPKKSIYKYKIEPTIEYFPAFGAVSKASLVKIRGLFNDYKFTEATKEVEGLKLEEALKKAEDEKT